MLQLPIELVQRSSLLGMLSQEEIGRHLQDGTIRLVTYHKNSVIHLEGEPCTHLEVILSGKVIIERIDEGGSLLSVAELHGGDILGGNLLFSQSAYYPMTIVAHRQTTIAQIERELLFDLLCKKPALLRLYLQHTSDHASILGQRIRHYTNRTIRECLLTYLRLESKRQRSSRVELTISKKALAERLGVERTSVSRELSLMRKDGLILFDAKSITLLE